MTLLDNYFSHLQSNTGAEAFVLVRDDAKIPPRSMKRRRTPRSASLPSSFGSSRKSRPEFEESEFQNPPCLPLRMESQDDLCACVDKKIHQQRSTIKASTATGIDSTESPYSRFKSLFGTEITAKIDAKCGLIHQTTRSLEMKTLASLAAPKFPTRRGSHDDLSTCLLSSSRKGGRLSDISMMANKKLELSQFLDEVTHVLSPSEDTPRPPLEPYRWRRHSGWVN